MRLSTGLIRNEAVPRHKQILREVICLEDLEPAAPPVTIPLNIQDQSRYFETQSKVDTTTTMAGMTPSSGGSYVDETLREVC